MPSELTLAQWSMLLAEAAQSEAAALELLGIALYKVGNDAKEIAQAKFGVYQPATPPFPAWAPLADYTVEKKGNNVPLIEEGDYSRSVDMSFDLQSATNAGVEIGSNDHAAPYMEYGFQNVRVSQPHWVAPRAIFGPAAIEAVQKNLEIFAETVIFALFPGRKI